MKIGIEGRFLTHPQRGGFKSYTRAVVAALAAVDTENRYIVYTDRPDTSINLPDNFEVKPVSAPNAILREQVTLPLAMIRDHIDIAHFPCNTAPVLFGPAMVLTVHDAIALRRQKNKTVANGKQRLLHSYWRAIIPRGAHRAVLTVTNSGYTLADLQVALGLRVSAIRVVPIPVSPIFSSGSTGSPHPEVPEDTSYVLAFASPDGRKNHSVAIGAYRSVVKEFPGLRLVLVCSHADLKVSNENAHGEGIVPLDPVTSDQLVWLYRNAAVLVFPSLDEGFGLPPLEAMASGTPVIASNAGSLSEVLGDCALLTEPNDVEGMANMLRRVLSEPDLRTDLVCRGLDRAAGFTPANMGRKLVDVYREAVQRPMP